MTHNLSSSQRNKRIEGDVRNAQLTLISILLGAMLAALLLGLPAGYIPNLQSSPTSLGLNMRILATFLAAAEIWIQYAWAVTYVHWRYSLRHNATYFLLSGIAMCLGLSVTHEDLWLVWAGVTCIGSALAFTINLSVVAEEKTSMDRSAFGASTETEGGNPKPSSLIRLHSLILIAITVVTSSVFFDAGLNQSHCVIPGSRPLACLSNSAWHVTASAFSLLFILSILLIHGLILMPREQKSAGY